MSTEADAPSGRTSTVSLVLFWLSFAMLLGAVGCVALAQFQGSTLTPWIALGLSGGAVVFALAAMLVRPRR